MKRKLLVFTLFLTLVLTGCNTNTETPVDQNPTTDPYEVIQDAMEQVTVPATVEYILLPANHGNVTISWSSNIAGSLTDTGHTIQGAQNKVVTLTGLFTYQGKTLTKLYETTILFDPSLQVEEPNYLEEVTKVKDELTFEETTLTESIAFYNTKDGVTLDYSSSDTTCMESNGVIHRPTDTEGDCIVTLTVTFSKGDVTVTEQYTFTIVSLTTTVTYTGYYAGADGLTGAQLKQFLHDLIDDHTVLTYDEVKYALRDTDEDPNNSNNVILLYTGRSQSKSTFGGGANDWNREHVWAKSHGGFGNAMGPGTDLHHLRPTDASVNSSRGNLDFDEGGSLVNETTGCYKDGDSWEPRDEVKGDVARMMFYMATRYEGDDYLDLELNNQVNNSGAYIGRLSVLLQWHIDDPVDDFEMNRNNVIETYQGNRNPFIDHPEFVALIWS